MRARSLRTAGSLRMATVQSPIIPRIAALARAHPGTLSLGQGVSWWGPPAGALKAISGFGSRHEDHLYGAVEGDPGLRERIGSKLARENGVRLEHGYRLMVTAGANMAFFQAVLAITDPGDEVILPLPWYFNQEMAIRMAGAVPVPVPCGTGYQIDPAAIASALTPRTRVVVTVSPNNPSGAVYPRQTLARINELCRERGLWHLSDEAYEYFTWGQARHFSPASLEGAAGHTISFYSLSKAYGFASWRIGYMVYPEALHEALLKVQDTNLICPPAVTQRAAVACLEEGAGYTRRRLEPVARVREEFIGALDAIEGCELPVTEGAFYFLLGLDTRLSGMEVARRLIAEHGVAVIPGEAFGMTGGCHLRVSYGCLRPEDAGAALDRLTTGLRACLAR
ncbi:MAG: pyridoxal phosphate-dependent aminotransferase [Gammaproteobacteria bacterium]|nr:MAG: pyridoxal phosphate-dependent aminotransferase [Gammaproteobacteria bacterium]